MPDAPLIAIPTGALVLLIGPSGCGKSTFARRHFAPTEIVSSDALRAMLTDDENDQRATPLAFSLLHRLVAGRLEWGRTTVVDATNVEISARRSLLNLAAHRGAPAVAIVLDLPLAVCLARNLERHTRRIPERSLRRQHALLQRSLAGLRAEGFVAIHRLADPLAVERARIKRTRRAAVAKTEERRRDA